MLTTTRSYLTEKKQQVKINNNISDIIDPPPNLIQHINLWSSVGRHVFTNCKFLLFADDLKLYLSINYIDDCDKLQNNLIKLENWCQSNSLRINVSKCYQITFTKRKKTYNF